MHREIQKQFYLLNSTFYPVKDFDPEKILETPSVYEVIRVIDGIPLFWEAHLDRMKKSLHLLGYSFSFEPSRLYAQLLDLIEKNQTQQDNIKLVLNQLDTPSPNLYLFFISSHYPSTEQLRKGVPVILHKAERQNPHAKVIATDFRAPILEALRRRDAYEALLVNPAGEITEGSRSNFFLVKDGHFYTSPPSKILEGVTRKVVVSLLHRLGYPLTQMPITKELLEKGDGLFLTGTSPGVLPINQVDQQAFDSGAQKEIQDIQKMYDHFVHTYIEIHKTKEGAPLHPPYQEE